MRRRMQFLVLRPLKTLPLGSLDQYGGHPLDCLLGFPAKLHLFQLGELANTNRSASPGAISPFTTTISTAVAVGRTRMSAAITGLVVNSTNKNSEETCAFSNTNLDFRYALSRIN